jgi:hypothetical protein
MAKDDKKVDLDSLVDAVGASKDGELEKNILLSDVDPADGSQEVRENKNNPEIFGGTSAEDLPEAPVDAMYAAQVLPFLILKQTRPRKQPRRTRSNDQ